MLQLAVLSTQWAALLGFIVVHFFFAANHSFGFVLDDFFLGPHLTHSYPTHIPTPNKYCTNLCTLLIIPTDIATLRTSYPIDLIIILTTYPSNLVVMLTTYPIDLTFLLT